MSHPHTPNKGACGHQKNCTSDSQTNPPHTTAVSPHSLPRCSQPLSTNQTPHPTTKARRQPVLSPVSHTRDEEIAGLLSQSPIVCLMISRRRYFPTNSQRLLLHPNHTHYRRGPSHESPRSPNPHRNVGGPIGLVVLLRKEVIQPHLPVRLPCYDFVPIADPTFDGSPPYGLGHRLRVLPTFMT